MYCFKGKIMACNLWFKTGILFERNQLRMTFVRCPSIIPLLFYVICNVNRMSFTFQGQMIPVDFWSSELLRMPCSPFQKLNCTIPPSCVAKCNRGAVCEMSSVEFVGRDKYFEFLLQRAWNNRTSMMNMILKTHTVRPSNTGHQGTNKFHLLLADFCYCQYRK